MACGSVTALLHDVIYIHIINENYNRHFMIIKEIFKYNHSDYLLQLIHLVEFTVDQPQDLHFQAASQCKWQQEHFLRNQTTKVFVGFDTHGAA